MISNEQLKQRIKELKTINCKRCGKETEQTTCRKQYCKVCKEEIKKEASKKQRKVKKPYKAPSDFNRIEVKEDGVRYYKWVKKR